MRRTAAGYSKMTQREQARFEDNGAGRRSDGDRSRFGSAPLRAMASTSIDIGIGIGDVVRRRDGATASHERAPLPQPPANAQSIPIMPASLPSLRATVARRAARAGLAPEHGDDLVLAVNELATNSIRHGGGCGTLTIWETNAALVCEVTDAGQLRDPLAGRSLPQPGQPGHYGLWLVHQVCDVVEQRTLPRGNLVRVLMRRA